MVTVKWEKCRMQGLFSDTGIALSRSNLKYHEKPQPRCLLLCWPGFEPRIFWTLSHSCYRLLILLHIVHSSSRWLEGSV